MTWIRTVPLSEGDEQLRQAIEGQKGLYPIEYATPVHPTGDGTSSIVASHSSRWKNDNSGHQNGIKDLPQKVLL